MTQWVRIRPKDGWFMDVMLTIGDRPSSVRWKHTPGRFAAWYQLDTGDIVVVHAAGEDRSSPTGVLPDGEVEALFYIARMARARVLDTGAPTAYSGLNTADARGHPPLAVVFEQNAAAIVRRLALPGWPDEP